MTHVLNLRQALFAASLVRKQKAGQQRVHLDAGDSVLFFSLVLAYAFFWLDSFVVRPPQYR